MKVKFETMGDEPKRAATARLHQAATALETSPDMQSGFTVLRRVHIEEGDRQSLTVFFGVNNGEASKATNAQTKD